MFVKKAVPTLNFLSIIRGLLRETKGPLRETRRPGRLVLVAIRSGGANPASRKPSNHPMPRLTSEH